MRANALQQRRFQLVLIKPSRYDDDGYPVQWLRSSIPSNSLAAVYGLAADAAERQVLGPDVAIDISVIDETNTRVKVDKLIDLFRRHVGFGLVGFVGVQSNQFPRTLDLARPLRAANIPVAVGGFHVSGCLAMLPEMPPDLKAALDIGISLFAGEAEDGRLDAVLCDAAAGALKPIYNFISDLPNIAGTPAPYLPTSTLGRTLKHHASFDAGRGCPFQCSFCTIINVQGRKSRRRSADDVEALIRKHYAEGIRRYFITDDNFARNKDWELIFDRIIEMRERENFDLRLVIQVDTLCHKIENFVEKAARAGVKRVFIGLENINPANLAEAKKRQNKITEYRAMLLAWKEAHVVTYGGYILGFPADTPQSVREDIEIIKKELPIDILTFYYLTPLPGSEDHKVLWQKGAWMDPDMNNYDLEHPVAAHPTMSAEQLKQVYKMAWQTFYTPDHIERILRRGAAAGGNIASLLGILMVYSRFVEVEKVNPLQGGIFRLKFRRDRRPGMPIEPVWKFYPKYGWEILSKHARFVAHWARLEILRQRIRRDPNRRNYMDEALMPVVESETETLGLFTHSASARDAVKHIRHVEELTHGVGPRATPLAVPNQVPDAVPAK
jgi:hypothetical protein